MARIQVLPLNTVRVGDSTQERFAIIIDKITPEDDALCAWLSSKEGYATALRDELGAESIMVVADGGELTVAGVGIGDRDGLAEAAARALDVVRAEGVDL